MQFHEVEARFKSEDILGWTLGRIDKTQARLAHELKFLRDPAVLDPPCAPASRPCASRARAGP